MERSTLVALHSLYAILRHVEHHVVGSLRLGELQSELAKTVTEQLPHVGIVRLQSFIIAVRETQPDGCCLHQGGGGSNGQEVMYFLHAVDDLLRGNDIPQPPASDAVGL